MVTPKQTRPPTNNGLPKTTGTPSSTVVKPAPTGSLLSRARPVSEAYTSFVHMLLYGRNRTGKTTLACTFPKPLLLVSIEPALTGGARSVQNVPGVNWLRVHPTDPGADFKTSDELEALGKEMRADPACGGYKTVVIDSGTSLDEIVLAEICAWDEPAVMLAVGHTRPGSKVSTDQYTERSERSRRVLRPFMELKCHLVVTANEKDHNPQEGNRKSTMVRGLHQESFYAAAMGGGTVKWLQDAMEITQLLVDREVRKEQVPDGTGGTVEMEVETGRTVRRLRCLYHPNYAAGFRAPLGTDVPEFIDEPTWAKIEAVANGKPLPKPAPRK